MSSFVIGLLIGGVVAWICSSNYTHHLIGSECERLGGFFVGKKTYKCVHVIEGDLKGTPQAILDAEKSNDGRG